MSSSWCRPVSAGKHETDIYGHSSGHDRSSDQDFGGSAEVQQCGEDGGRVERGRHGKQGAAWWGHATRSIAMGKSRSKRLRSSGSAASRGSVLIA
jgi:hypothetical protein